MSSHLGAFVLPRDSGGAHQAPRCPWTSEFITSCWKGLALCPLTVIAGWAPALPGVTGRFPPAGGGSIPMLLKGSRALPTATWASCVRDMVPTPHFLKSPRFFQYPDPVLTSSQDSVRSKPVFCGKHLNLKIGVWGLASAAWLLFNP